MKHKTNNRFIVIMIYHVRKKHQTQTITQEWNAEIWADTQQDTLIHSMGDKPSHFPETFFKAAYDHQYLHLFFMVQDRYVISKKKKFQDHVCEDSCVEFFFYPGNSTAKGYFNLEINCCGALMFKFQKGRNSGVVEITDKDAEKISVVTSVNGKQIVNEIRDPLTWTLFCSLPFSVINRYVKIKNPAEGSRWRANFYKCADKSSHPHWLTWNRVDRAKPDFHRPEFFGTLIF